jgi:hypothetical protein
MIELLNERERRGHLFRVFTDAQVGIALGSVLDSHLIESHQDEDIDTDDEILIAGTRTCQNDLLPLIRRMNEPHYVMRIHNQRLLQRI